MSAVRADLPLRGASAAARSSRCPRSHAPCRGPRAGLRILIIDPLHGLEAVRHLRERGHGARAIGDIQGGVHMGESFRPHVCIVNLATCQSACESGWQLRMAAWGRRCVLIAAQALDASEQHRALESGFCRTVAGAPASPGWLARLHIGSMSSSLARISTAR